MPDLKIVVGLLAGILVITQITLLACSWAYETRDRPQADKLHGMAYSGWIISGYLLLGGAYWFLK